MASRRLKGSLVITLFAFFFTTLVNNKHTPQYMEQMYNALKWYCLHSIVR